jgi:flagellar biosynthesis component FlhA
MVPRSEVTQPVRRRSRVIRRRRQNFQRLLVVAGITLILGLVPALRWMLFVHLAVDASIGLYVARLLRWKHDEEERNRVVTPLLAEVTAGDDEQHAQLG